MTYHIEFDIGERVHADEDESLTMIVTAITIRKHGNMIECSYFSDAASHAVWVEEWRLSRVE